MGTPYIGEVRLFGGNFAPLGWAFCDGSLQPISQYDALFNLIGTTYGGDGQSTFALPDLRSRVPVHMGTGPGLSTYVIGQAAGTENVTLLLPQIPNHTHALNATTVAATTPTPSASVVLGDNSGTKLYTAKAPSAATGMTAASAGSSQAHTNLMPYQTISFIISLFGIFPTPN
jgi:microcystin-dependent protein